jgi:hypothetical protein
MKKGQSYITLHDTNDKHPLIIALRNKGINNITLIYATRFSSNWGWDMVNCDKHLIGWNGWLGYTKSDALNLINRLEIKDDKFLYLR